MSKSDAKVALGLKSDAALARYFNVKRQAVSKWMDAIPEGRQWELKAKRPDLFGPAPAGEGGNG